MTSPAVSVSTEVDQAIELRGFSHEQLSQVQRPRAAVRAGEVRVRMRAASLNFRDQLVVTGNYGIDHSALPFIPVSDGAGEVIEVGEGVSRLAVGDRVTTLMTRDWISGPLTPQRHAAQNGGPLDGVLAQTVVLPERALSRFADHLDFAEAACLPIAALTAWSSLCESGLQPGQTVLATGSGNVSLSVLQLARLWGAKVIVTTSDVAERGPRLEALGADAVVDYRAPDWPQRVLAANGGEGIDVAVENGGTRTAGATLQALRQGGFVAFVGVLAIDGQPAADLTLPLLLKNVRARGMLTGNRDAYEAMQRAVALHRLRPVIDSRFPLARAADAFERAFKAKPFGKVVIDIG